MTAFRDQTINHFRARPVAPTCGCAANPFPTHAVLLGCADNPFPSHAVLLGCADNLFPTLQGALKRLS